MTEIAVCNASASEVTIIPNLFIEQYMPQANGEFVKVYLYLLRVLSDEKACFTLADGADALNCTERDILRALKYWASTKLLELSLDENQTLIGIRLLPLQEQASLSSKKTAISSLCAEPAKAEGTTTAEEAKAPSSKTAAPVSRETLKRLKDEEDFVQLLFLAEQYLGRTLSPTDTGKIAYFYDQMGLSLELIEYLIEYCVSGGHKSIRYIETVAFAWAEKGITTVEQAKADSSGYHKNYFAILKALGIQNRNPAEAELTFMNTWMKEYGFTLDIILEACSRTVLKTGQASFPYADKILRDWRKNEVHTLTDIEPLDAKHSRKKVMAKAAPKVAASGNRFNNFHQRDYDFDALERQLLSR